MKHAKNYPVMIIDKKDFEKFEQQYMLDVIQDPTYRYGQAFLNYFWPIVSKCISDFPVAFESTLWEAKKEQATDIINFYFSID